MKIPSNQTITRLLAASLLAGLAIFLIAQHQLVFIYHDDWGFSVLDHMARQEGFDKQDFSTAQFLGFLKDMYLDWSGRVFSFGAHILAERVGVGFVQMLQATLIFVFILLALRFTQVAAASQMSAFAVAWGVLLYLTMPESILAGGVYWYAASSSNAWTLPVFLFAAYRVLLTGRVSWLSAVLFAFSLTFHEQVAVSVLAFLAAWRLWQWWFQNESLWQDVTKLLAVFIAALPVIFAPGNFVRKAVSAPFYGDRSMLQVFIDNLNAISFHLLWPEWANIFILMMMVSAFFLVAWLWLEARLVKTEKIIAGVSPALLALFFLFDQPAAFAVTFMITFTWFLYRVCRQRQHGGLIFAMHLAALASLLLVFMAPYFMGRTGIVLLFLETIPVLHSVWLIQSRLSNFVKIATLLPLTLLALPAAATIYSGYANNAASFVHNDAQLRALAQQQASYSPIRPADKHIRLFKFQNNKYAEIPADQHQHIQAWMKKYYGLAPDTQFIWLDPQAQNLTLNDIPQKTPDLVENGFDIYIQPNRLLYVKPNCQPQDKHTFFELRYFPKDKREGDPYYFNQTFVFDGVEHNGTCLTLKQMPNEPFAEFKTHFHHVTFNDSQADASGQKGFQITSLVSKPVPETQLNIPQNPPTLQHATLDIFENQGARLTLHGWAFQNGQPAQKSYIRLKNAQHSLIYTAQPNARPDVKNAYPQLSSDQVGFTAIIPTHDIPPGQYRIQYLLQDTHGNIHQTTFKGVDYQKAPSPQTLSP